MTGGTDGDLNRRLSGLSAGLDEVSLPGPAAARRRAAQRTRHQVAGGVLATVAAVAAGVVVLDPTQLSTAPEPAPPATSVAPSPPAPTTTPDELSAALLTAEEVTAATGLDWIESAEPAPAVACDPAGVLDTISSTVDRSDASFQADGAGTVRQELVRFAVGSSAEGLWDELTSCLPDRGSAQPPQVTDELEIRGVGDEARLLRYYADPAAAGSDAVTIALIRYRDVLSVTVRTEPQENTVGDALDTELPVAAARRLCDVLFGESCVSEPELVDSTGDGDGDGGTEPPGTAEPALLQLADDPFLTDDDLAAVGTYTGFRRTDQPAADDGWYAFGCLDRVLAADAADSRAATWTHDLDGTVAEIALGFPDIPGAMELITDHTILPDECGEVVETHEQTVQQPAVVEVAGADEALAWTVLDVPLPEDPGSSGSFHGVGMARSGNVVVVIVVGAMDDPLDGDWAGWASGTLATALERAVG